MILYAEILGMLLMGVGGIALLGVALALAARGVRESWINLLDMSDVREAIDEWKDRHPDKWEACRRRNGSDQ